MKYWATNLCDLDNITMLFPCQVGRVDTDLVQTWYNLFGAMGY